MTLLDVSLGGQGSVVDMKNADALEVEQLEIAWTAARDAALSAKQREREASHAETAARNAMYEAAKNEQTAWDALVAYRKRSGLAPREATGIPVKE